MSVSNVEGGWQEDSEEPFGSRPAEFAVFKSHMQFEKSGRKELSISARGSEVYTTRRRQYFVCVRFHVAPYAVVCQAELEDRWWRRRRRVVDEDVRVRATRMASRFSCRFHCTATDQGVDGWSSIRRQCQTIFLDLPRNYTPRR